MPRLKVVDLPAPIEKKGPLRHLFPAAHFSYAILVRLIEARGWCELSPNTRGRIFSGQIELSCKDGCKPKPFLLR